MVFLGGPSHRERRQVASRYFTPRQIGRYRAELDEIAGVLIDRLAGPGSGPVDLVEQLALPFASLSLGRLLAIAGAYLAARQGEVLFPRLLRRFPGLRLAGPPVYRSPGSTLRGLESLPLYLDS